MAICDCSARWRSGIVLLGIWFGAGTADAGDHPFWPGQVQTRLELGMEARSFADDELPVTADLGLAISARLDWRHRHAAWEQRLRVSAKADPYDSGRNRLNIEEAQWQWRADPWRVRLGAELVNWTATEAFHPADVINARDLDSDLENFDKLGEPMALVEYASGGGSVWQFMAMPWYTQTRFAPPASRVSFVPPGIDLDGRARRFDGDGQWRRSNVGPQFALRWQRSIGSGDYSLHYVAQMDRLQPLAAWSLADGRSVAVFQSARQFGGTWQQAFESGWLLKLEAAHRRFARPADPQAAASAAGLTFAGAPFPDRNHTAVALGLEYTRAIGLGDSTFLFEVQTIAGVSRPLATTLSPFQRDVLIGYRLGLANAASGEWLAYAIVDLDHPGERLWNLSYQQRIGEHYTLELGVRLFDAAVNSPDSGLAALRQADHLRLNVTRYF